MHRTTLPISALPAWSKLNDVNFLDVRVADLSSDETGEGEEKGARGKGYGIVSERSLSSKDTFDKSVLLSVPHELVLGGGMVEEVRKVDKGFGELVGGVGGKSTRGDVMLFLLMQMSIGSSGEKHGVGVCNPWTEYVKMLPEVVPVPSLWMEPERVALIGTSLEVAVNAKLAALLKEFEEFREKTSTISWCQKLWWENESVSITDWALVDAWYRSRCLEIPNSGSCMIPCIDMVNHSSEPNAYYEKTADGGVSLLLRPDIEIEMGTEITISYGTAKSEAEMLFNYGFIDDESTVQSLILTLEPFPDDPFGKAKAAAFLGTPTVQITLQEGDKIQWESPFLYFMCLNEEDGLDFGVLQETDGSTSSLRTSWQGSDVTDKTDTFEALIEDHPLKDVLKLRVVALLHDRIRKQLERLYESEEMANDPKLLEVSDPTCLKTALQLRKSETAILERAFEAVDTQKTSLLESEVVLRYLGSMAKECTTPERALEEGDANNDDEDFS